MRRALVGAPGRAAHRADPRRVRLPGPEVLGGVAGLHPAFGVAADGRRLPVGATEALRYGDVTDLTNFGGAVIDERAFAKNVKAIERAKSAAGVTVAVGGEYDDSEGYFVRPTVLLSDDPTDEAFSTEYFGPILSVHVYPDDDYDRILDVVDTGAPYALTGAVIADDRAAVLAGRAAAALRGGQLLRQRQAHRRGRRAAAVRRRAGLGHQRQGGLGAEPAALDVGPVDQGDVRPADRPHLSPHGGVSDGCSSSGSRARPSWPPAGGTGCAAPPSGCRSRGRSCTASYPVRPSPMRWIPLHSCVIRAAWYRSTTSARTSPMSTRRTPPSTPISICSTRSAARDEAPVKVRPLEVSLKLSALGQALPRDGEKIALENAHTICERAQRRRGVGHGGRRGPHHDRLDAVDRARAADRIRLARHRSAGLPQAHPRRLRGVRRVGCPHPAVQGRLRRARFGRLPGPR